MQSLYSIQITDQTGKANKFCLLIRQSLVKTLRELHLTHVEVSILIVGVRKMRALNNQYRNKNYATDVLSFPQNNHHHSNHSLLGDIVISPAIAHRQAKENKHSVQFEIAFLVIHGLLHLLGYDHNTPSKTKKMFHLQNRLLKRLFNNE